MSDGELQHGDMVNLIKYTTMGAGLPVNKREYQERLKMPDAVMNSHNATVLLEPIIETYAKMNAHCSKFNAFTYPEILRLAEGVSVYAKGAGNNPEGGSDYKVIFDLIQQLTETESAAMSKVIRQKVEEIIEDQVRILADWSQKSRQLMGELRQFEEDTMRDQESIQDDIARCRKLYGGWFDASEVQAAMEMLEKSLAVAAVRAIKVDDRTKASGGDDSLKRAEILSGWLGISRSVASSDNAATISDLNDVHEVTGVSAVSELWNLQVNFPYPWIWEFFIFAYLRAIMEGLTNAKTLIAPCSKAIELLMGNWDAFTDDLGHLKDMLDKDIRFGSPIVVVHVFEKKLKSKWDTFGAFVERFKTAATVPTWQPYSEH